MNLVEFVKNLSAQGVELWGDGDQLCYRAPKDALTSTLLTQIKQHKAEILQLLHERADNSKAYPLSHGQRALWFLHQLAPESTAYNIIYGAYLQSDLDILALQKSFETLVERHPLLCTTYGTKNGEPFQQVQKHQKIHFKVKDASNWSQDDLNTWLAEEADRPFDLEQEPLLRINLLTQFSVTDTLGAKKTIFLVTAHHIVIDFWSLEILIDELSVLYEATKTGKVASLLPQSLQYQDYVRWEAEMLTSPEGEKLWAYWQKQLAGELPVLNLPTDRPRPPMQTYRGTSLFFELDDKLTSKLRELAKGEEATLYMTLMTAFLVLLLRYTNQEDILIGSPVAGRSLAEFERIVGYFVNPLVLRVNLSGNPTFPELLRRVRHVVLEALEHEQYPFPLLVERLQPIRDLSRSPLCQVAFVWDQPRQRKGLLADFFALEQRGAAFDLNLTILDTGGSLKGGWEYNTDLFNSETITRMSGHFQRLLEEIVANPLQQISSLPLLTAIEQHQLLVGWNDTQTDYPQEKCIHQLFEVQVEQTPDSIAVVFEDEQLTYRELNSRANKIAHYLKVLGVKPEVLVGLCVERSLEMVVGLLAILKAGGTYVPLDPAYPKERLAFMLEDAQVSVLLTQQWLVEGLPKHKAQVVYLDTDKDADVCCSTMLYASYSEENLANCVTSDNLAYVIYTSGSTGKPKGVLVAHSGLCNLAVAQQRLFDVQPDSHVLQFASLSFDASVWEFVMALIAGATLCLATQENLLPGPTLIQVLREQAITIVTLPPSVLAVLPTEELTALRTIIVAGEACSPDVVARWAPNRRFFNAYGPTEATVCATASECSLCDQKPPIGRPIANTQVYLLDAQLQPIPVGIPGDLYISSVGLARGYLNRPHITAERFIPNPFSAELGTRLYKTGDLGRYLPDGNIEFLGRSDDQVKLRGFRIELGEIEAALNQHAAVLESLVMVREDGSGSKFLAAYVVSNQQQSATANELRYFLKDKLPDYMVPSAFVILDQLPLTPNGKVDLRALPVPEITRLDVEANYVAPQTEIEHLIAAVWQEKLQIEQVGIYDNFFELGGHSLLLVQIYSKLQEIFPQKLSITNLFQYPTISLLAKYLIQEQSKNQTDNLRVDGNSINQKSQFKRKSRENTEIAVIGMSGRFPGAKDVNTFWQNLRDGVESISTFSDRELESSGIDPAMLSNNQYVKAGAVLEDVELFDASFFGFNAREAEIMDPQHRLFLECAWEAIESAGYNTETYKGAIAVFAGVGISNYLLFNLNQNPNILESVGRFQVLIGNDKDFLPTRVSYKLNLKGPSINVQTACSTSLVAVHLACQSLLSGESDIALAGGISIRLPQKTGYLYQEGGILSPDGHCRAFDARSQGTISGNGVGIVVLKPLVDALADGDCIHAIIKGSAINNDASLKVGYTAPSVDGQEAVISEALAIGAIKPDTVTYIETHGTGTTLGDPIEIAALTQAFRNITDAKGFCAIGSLKTNVGHLDAAAGVAGLIKTVMALKHKLLPPSLHFEEPNPKIDFANSPFYVNTSLCEWKTNGMPRRAGVSSFGIGGTNAHVIIEESPVVEVSGKSRSWFLLVLSAKSDSALDTATTNLVKHLEQHPDTNFADVAYTYQVGRSVFNYRRMLVCQNLEDAEIALSSLDPKRVFTSFQESKERPVVFMFSGQGAQYVNMGVELYENEPTFREQVDLCSELLKPYLGIDLRHVLYPSEEQVEAALSELKQTAITQPALFVIEYALAKLWRSWGVHPQAMIGHSIGEYVAACLSDVFSLEDALALVVARGQLMQKLPLGSMLAVPLSENEVQPLLNNQLSVAAINGSSACVVSGSTEAVEQLKDKLAQQAVNCRLLHTSHAFHSHMMNPIMEPFTEQVKKIKLKPPQIPFISNVTGTWITAAEAVSPNYWVKHLRSSVRFADGLQELYKDWRWILLEVGPGRTLATLARQHPDKPAEQVVLNSLRHPHEQQSDVAFLLTTLGHIWLAGVQVDWSGFYTHEQRHRLPLPTYPFERQRYWIEPQKQENPSQVLLNKQPDIADWFYVPSWKRSISFVETLAEDIEAEKSCYLVFVDTCGLGSQLVKQLEQKGNDVTIVMAGEQFTKHGENLYQINPRQRDDYEVLLKELDALDKTPKKILHLWSVTANTPTELEIEFFEKSQYLGFYSLLFLVQAIAEQNLTHAIQIVVVSNNMQEVTGSEVLCPEKATLLGPCRVIPQEYPYITCKSIDIVTSESESGYEKTLTDGILSELFTKPFDSIVAYLRSCTILNKARETGFINDKLRVSALQIRNKPGFCRWCKM